MTEIRRLNESTIKKIAAGEIISKLFNIVKELLENSLDAGSTNIRVIIGDSNNDSLEIFDNGHGIARSNAKLLCERHATSKLHSFGDLINISTFGFRGEALASISEIGMIEVTTFNPIEDDVGWFARYLNGALVAEPCEKSLSQNGTHIKITNIFEAFRGRKMCLRDNFVEDRKSILDLIKRYAISLCERVTLTLSEIKGVDLLCILAPMPVKSCIGSLFGLEMEESTLEWSGQSTGFVKVDLRLAFAYKRVLTNAQTPMIILFINDRLIESNDLKKESINVISDYVELRNHNTLLLISMNVPSHDIDVNTHPAKATVCLHYHVEVMDYALDCLRKLLHQGIESSIMSSSVKSKPLSQLIMSSSNSSQSPPQPTVAVKRLALLAPGSAGIIDDTQKPVPTTPELQPKRQYSTVHNDSSQRTLLQLPSIGIKSKKNSDGPKRQYDEIVRPYIFSDSDDSDQVSTSDKASNNHSSGDRASNRQSVGDKTSDQPSLDETAPDRASTVRPLKQMRDLRLRSIKLLRDKVVEERAKSNCDVIKHSVFVGIFDHNHALIQHETKLLAINLKAYLKEQFYQFYLYDFGNFPPIEILPPGNDIKFIIETYLDDIRNHDSEKYDALIFNTTDSVIDELMKHSGIYNDYLQMQFSPDQILSIPCLFPDEVPNLVFLGRFLVQLANIVDYSCETKCFHTIGRVIADFYSEPPANLRDREVHRKYHELVETQLYVAIKNYLIIPEWLFTEQNIMQMSDTKDLYKVFERC